MTREEVICYHILVQEASWLAEKLKKMRVRIDNPRIPQLTGMPGARNTTPGSAQERYADEYLDTAPAYEEQLQTIRRKMRRIEAAVDRLPARERMVVRYRCFEKLSYKATADKMDMSVSRVTQILQSAWKLLEGQTDG